MEFAKKEFIQKIEKLDHLLKEDFGVFASSVRKEGKGNDRARHKQKLVEQLQYHDIIRQKMQHVGGFADVLELEFLQYKREKTGAETLSGLLELSMALLQFAGLEYKEVRQEIIVQFEELHLSEAWLDGQYALFQQEMKELVDYLECMYLELVSADKLGGGKPNLEKLRKICQSFSMQSEREVLRSLLYKVAVPFELEDINSEHADDDIELF